MSEFTNYLTGIADAIRAKKGTAAPIPAAAFSAEIAGLPSGWTTPIFATVSLILDTTAFVLSITTTTIIPV